MTDELKDQDKRLASALARFDREVSAIAARLQAEVGQRPVVPRPALALELEGLTGRGRRIVLQLPGWHEHGPTGAYLHRHAGGDAPHDHKERAHG